MSIQPHRLSRQGALNVCSACGASWKGEPRSACPGAAGQRLYRRWKDVPPDLATKTMIRRAGLRLPRGAQPVGILEDGFHFRYKLYPLTAAVPRRPRTSREQASITRARELRGTCQACGERPGPAGQLLRRRDYRRFKEELEEDRLCETCYGARWRVHRDRVLGERRASYRALVPHFAVIDFETTALVRPHAIEVAVWGATGLLYHSFIDPGNDAVWDEQASAVHRITPAETVGAPSWVQMERELHTLLAARGISVLGAWGSFDKDVVWSERARRGVDEPWPVRWVNLMDLYDIELRREPPYWRGTEPRRSPPMSSLRTACKRYDVAPGSHRAAADARAAYQVFEAMLVEPSCRTPAPATEPSRPPAAPSPLSPGLHDG